MTRPEEIAAAISSWRVLSVYASEGVKASGNELARLLRAANPPAGAERATETKRLTAEDRIGPGCVAPPVRPEPAAPFGLTDEQIEAWDDPGLPTPEPATPAVGEDLKAHLVAMSREDAITVALSLSGRIDALLAEVARLTEDRERSHVINRAYRQSAHDSAANFRKADVERLEMRAERDKALATLAAVRKVAEECDCKPNPCAAEILNVLEGKP